MHRFFEHVTMPICEELAASKSDGSKLCVIEVGIDRLDSTLKFFERFGEEIHMVLIDPSPAVDVLATMGEFKSYVYYNDLSINVLGQAVKSADIVLLDGDHNYFTVLSELELIKNFDHFPIVLLHDVAWPYGRRDFYYNPGNIPDKHKHSYTLEGLNPITNKTQQFGAINQGLCNSIEVNKPKMGVLTAVEDFMKSMKGFKFKMLPIWNGLGVIYDTSRYRDEIFDIFDMSPRKMQLFKEVEQHRLELDFALKAAIHKLDCSTSKE